MSALRWEEHGGRHYCHGGIGGRVIGEVVRDKDGWWASMTDGEEDWDVACVDTLEAAKAAVEEALENRNREIDYGAMLRTKWARETAR